MEKGRRQASALSERRTPIPHWFVGFFFPFCRAVHSFDRVFVSPFSTSKFTIHCIRFLSPARAFSHSKYAIKRVSSNICLGKRRNDENCHMRRNPFLVGNVMLIRLGCFRLYRHRCPPSPLAPFSAHFSYMYANGIFQSFKSLFLSSVPTSSSSSGIVLCRLSIRSCRSLPAHLILWMGDGYRLH